MKQQFYSNGKLLLTSEYLVLNGATALAIPTRFGQNLIVESIEQSKIIWNSFDEKKNSWFSTILDFNFNEINTTSTFQNHKKIANRLTSILTSARKLNPNFLNNQKGYRITTHLDFPRNWGLGTSSTLINNIAQWAKINAFELLKTTFKGSGYDIAAAQNNNPILYTLNKDITKVKEVKLPWNFTEQLFFVYLNQKQNSQDAIAAYKPSKQKLEEAILQINQITQKICNCASLQEFEKLITQHEHIIANLLHKQPVKQLLFEDYRGSIKSLGAWGGDFVLATGIKKDQIYFTEKGYEVVIPFVKMIKKA
ncbi:MAG: GYDIA family GHMP kinase [Flavobacteriales bacterium]